MRSSRLSLLSLFLLGGLAACATPEKRATAPAGAPAATTTAASSAAPAANDLINAVVWMQASLEYELSTEQIYRMAGERLDHALANPDWDALSKADRDVPAQGLPPAVIFDVDETVLDNSPFQVRLIRNGGEYDEVTWAQWVKEAAAQPVPGAVEFARAAAQRGVKLYFLSNRAADLGEATYENLRRVGFPIEDHSQFLGLGTIVPGCEDNGSEKGCRRRLIGRSHRVLMQFGDQIGDMITILANTPDGREQAIAPYRGWFGERWFVLPNPSYGSWEPALFNNEWSAPAAQRRQLKLDALRH